mmetsp:Transcript_31597/g.79552  ORF Transcript_31597/g.79552 Transcript_31597/m.79552 type:complete len:312 (-) Transcript_31597:4-939(-)
MVKALLARTRISGASRLWAHKVLKLLGQVLAIAGIEVVDPLPILVHDECRHASHSELLGQIGAFLCVHFEEGCLVLVLIARPKHLLAHFQALATPVGVHLKNDNPLLTHIPFALEVHALNDPRVLFVAAEPLPILGNRHPSLDVGRRRSQDFLLKLEIRFRTGSVDDAVQLLLARNLDHAPKLARLLRHAKLGPDVRPNWTGNQGGSRGSQRGGAEGRCLGRGGKLRWPGAEGGCEGPGGHKGGCWTRGTPEKVAGENHDEWEGGGVLRPVAHRGATSSWSLALYSALSPPRFRKRFTQDEGFWIPAQKNE